MADIALGAMLAIAAVHRIAGAQTPAAATLSSKDVQVLSRALAFMQPPPAVGELAVLYLADNEASRRDAEAISAQIGSGLRVGNAELRPRLVDAATLTGGRFPVVITAAGANGPQVGAAIRAMHALCVTAELAAVQSGLCTMAVRSEPRVEIVVNHAAAAAAGVEFAAAFRMMIREI